jgi:hypothetical protein
VKAVVYAGEGKVRVDEVAVPELLRHGYSPRFSVGVVDGS